MSFWILKCLFLLAGIPIVIGLKRWVKKTNEPAEHPLEKSGQV